ncbi:AHH domain-containing protein [Novosphingobium mangrovi (ex Hu et al. 2023)]|uniref:AHH domain-containing protein n=1 Tax=Novosphingobium mangrovi (ex Hu et al. 2023) TaxID=2930094 RepID=A0ABT0A978_9SPHN|nr:AHH domain-containing protein [Novosphingobium mangrovi (ex Hu et al. 2023)]MCJ1959750.1 AHH domain-containing protein [Novosphingobium mangrovi (ex Hu et al. 2023)]
MTLREGGRRKFLAFRSVNRQSAPGYDPALQRHHLLPRQLLARTSFERMFREIGDGHARFEDFRENGLLLPCREVAALRLGLPLHRGPHRRYSELVTLRVGQIEADWARQRSRDPAQAARQAQMRLALLQRALRRFLLDTRIQRPLLNRYDPATRDFSELDEVAEALWAATPVPAVPPESAEPAVQAMPVRPRRRARAS